ncbi:MAG: hypothetical protein R2736_02565 [Solirubrobacterales bacterium]
MPALILFNEDTKTDRRRLRVDEEPEQVAKAPLVGFAQVTAKGTSIWVNASASGLVRGIRPTDQDAIADD